MFIDSDCLYIFLIVAFLLHTYPRIPFINTPFFFQPTWKNKGKTCSRTCLAKTGKQT